MTRSTFALDDLCPECLGFMPSHQRKLVLLVDGYAMPRREPRIVRLAKKDPNLVRVWTLRVNRKA
jgi:hypothetical protein